MRSADVAAELAEVRRLNALLADADPLSGEEKRRVDEFKASRKKQAKKKEISPEAQEEKKQKAKLAAQKRKAEKEAFLSSLTPEDRELYVEAPNVPPSRNTQAQKNGSGPQAFAKNGRGLKRLPFKAACSII